MSTFSPEDRSRRDAARAAARAAKAALRAAKAAQRRIDFAERKRVKTIVNGIFMDARNLPNVSLYNTHQTVTLLRPGFPPHTTVNRGVSSFGSNSRVRTVDPNWKVKVAKKQDATNPYTLVKTSGKALRLGGSLVVPANGSVSTGFIVYSPTTSFVHREDASADGLALKRLKAKLSDHVGFFNAAVPLAELVELRSGIESLIDSASDAYKKAVSAVSKHKKRGKSYRRAIADVWLQWSFGIKPTLGSIEDANEAISKFLTRSDHTVRLTGGALSSKVIGLVSPGTAGLSGASITGAAQGLDQLFYKYVGAWNLKVESSNDYSASNVFGLNPSSILPVLYELTPYSWLLDYFTSIGDYLNDTFVVPSGAGIYLSKTSAQLVYLTTSATHVPLPGVFMTNETLKRGEVSYKKVVRTKLTQLPHTTIRFKTLEEVGRRAENKLANLLSVLKSAHGEQHGTSGRRMRV